MLAASSRGRILEAVLFAVSSLVLYNIGVGALFFLVPLQVAAVRRGQQGLLLTAVLMVVMLVGVRAAQFLTAGSGKTWLPLTAMEITAVLLAVLGIVAVNLAVLARFRGLVRILASTLAAGLLAVPLLVLVPGLPGFQAALKSAFSDLATMLWSLFTTAGTPSPLGTLLQPEELMRTSVAYFLRSFLLDYFLLIAFTWWAGSAAGRRTVPSGAHAAPPRLAGFRLESYYLWPLILSWALILLDLFVGISAASYVAWNVGLVLLFLYGLQGLAIIRFQIEKHHLPRLLWILLLAVLAVMLAQPRASLVVVIAIPALGVSENWIRYRVRENLSPDQKGKE